MLVPRCFSAAHGPQNAVRPLGSVVPTRPKDSGSEAVNGRAAETGLIHWPCRSGDWRGVVSVPPFKSTIWRREAEFIELDTGASVRRTWAHSEASSTIRSIRADLFALGRRGLRWFVETASRVKGRMRNDLGGDWPLGKLSGPSSVTRQWTNQRPETRATPVELGETVFGR